jgi:hypothetical protein
VPKEMIHSKPKFFWDDIYSTLPWEEDTFVAYFMERSWHLIFDPNIKIKEGYKKSDYFTLKERLKNN